MDIQQIKAGKKHGDYVIVGAMLGITPSNAQFALNNEASQRHKDVKNALEKIIQSREQLINA